MTKRDKPIDWSGIAADYRHGKLSVREIARWFSVTEAAIRKKAKQEGWVRQGEVAHVVREPVVRHTIEATPQDPAALADKARALAGRMMDELDAVTSLNGELEDMICQEETDPRRRQALLRSISLDARAMTLKNLSTALKTLSEAAGAGGKKAQRQAAAEGVATGGSKFAPPAGPKLVVSNKS